MIGADVSGGSGADANANLYFIWMLEVLRAEHIHIRKTKTGCWINFPIENRISQNLNVTDYLKERQSALANFFGNNNNVNCYSSEQLYAVRRVDEDSYRFSTTRACIDAFLPTLKRSLCETTCLLLFPSNVMQSMLCFNHEEIMRILFYGLRTNPHHNIRKFITCDLLYPPEKRKNKTKIVDFKNCRMHLDFPYVLDFCTIVDDFSMEYFKGLEKLEKTYASERFGISVKENAIKLVKTKRWVWRRLVHFASKFYEGNGDSEWHIFRQQGYAIEVGKYTRDIPYHVKFIPLKDDMYENLLYDNDDVYIGLAIPSTHSPTENDFCLTGFWTAEIAHDWLTKKFIPYVFYYLDVFEPFYRKKRFIRKPPGFEKYLSKNDNDYFFRTCQKKRFYEYCRCF